MSGKRCRYCNDWCDMFGPRVCTRCSRTFHMVVYRDPKRTTPAMPEPQLQPWSPYPLEAS